MNCIPSEITEINAVAPTNRQKLSFTRFQLRLKQSPMSTR